MSSYITANVYRLKLNTTFNSNWENLRMSPKKGILIFGIPLKKNTRFSQKFGFLLIFFFRNSEFYSKKKFRFRNSGKSEFMTEPLPQSTLCKNKNSNFSALRLDRDLGVSQGSKNHSTPNFDHPPSHPGPFPCTQKHTVQK